MTPRNRNSPPPHSRGHIEDGRFPSLSASGTAGAVPGGESFPIRLCRDEILAVMNSWPNKPGTPIIPHKLVKDEKRVVLRIAPEAELDVDPFRDDPKMPGKSVRFLLPGGSTRTIHLPYELGQRLHIDELVEVIDRPEDEDWIRIKYCADEACRIVIFGEGEPRPAMGLLRGGPLPAKLARGDRLVIVAHTVARLWDVDDAAARSEGVPAINQRRGRYYPCATNRLGFEAIWNELHAPLHSFDKANWWVQVLQLKRDFDE